MQNPDIHHPHHVHTSQASLVCLIMADLEAVFTDISYIMAMEKSRNQPAARVGRKIQLSDPRFVVGCGQHCLDSFRGCLTAFLPLYSIHNVMHWYLKERGEVSFEHVFSQRIGKLGLDGSFFVDVSWAFVCVYPRLLCLLLVRPVLSVV